MPSASTSMAHARGYYRADCRMCRSKNLEVFLDFGMHPHSDGFRRADDTSVEQFFPLGVAQCVDCGQVQLTYVVHPSILYGTEDYIYDSRITATGRAHFLGMAEKIVQDFQIPNDSLALDIGSNTGLLLSGFKAQGMRVQGVDPSPTMTDLARKDGIDTLTAVFSSDVAKQVVAEKGKAAVITGTNVFAHIDDLDDVMEGVSALLQEKGIFVIEAPYLVDLYEKMEYDTIYHQHLSYLSIKPLARFFERFGMSLFDVQKTAIHGGSIRLFVARQGDYEVRPVVAEMVQHEESLGMHTTSYAHAFARKVSEHRQALVRLLTELKDGGKTIAGIGALAKGSTLLNYCGIGPAMLDFVTEKNPLKIGRFTPGTRIPILADGALLERKPDYALILAWNFAPEIMKNLTAYTQSGGRFILPIPSPQVL